MSKKGNLMEYKINRYKYVCKKSSEMNKEEIDNFIKIFNRIFNSNHDKKWFKWKYVDNIYGNSYIVMVYNNKGEIIAVRGLWRNDINNNIKSFQPVDTGVLKEYRGNGIFSQMTKIVLQNVKNKLIYNFPNSNSFPGYLKLGWRLKCEYNMQMGYNLIKILNSGYLEKIDDKYLIWRFGNDPTKKYYYIKKKDIYFLLSYKKYGIFCTLGIFDEKYKKYFKKIIFPIIFYYYSISKSNLSFLNKKCNLVIKNDRNKEGINIPIFRRDAI